MSAPDHQERAGSLPAPFEDARVQVHDFGTHIVVVYLGEAELLIAAGAASADMFERHPNGRYKSVCGMDSYRRYLKKSPTVGRLGRMELQLHLSHEAAWHLPGAAALLGHRAPNVVRFPRPIRAAIAAPIAAPTGPEIRALAGLLLRFPTGRRLGAQIGAAFVPPGGAA